MSTWSISAPAWTALPTRSAACKRPAGERGGCRSRSRPSRAAASRRSCRAPVRVRADRERRRRALSMAALRGYPLRTWFTRAALFGEALGRFALFRIDLERFLPGGLGFVVL